MSTNVAAAERAAEQAANDARKARAKHEQAVAEVTERNAQRKRDFWADAAEQDKREVARLSAARRAVIDAVTGCDGAAVMDAYLTYARTHAEVATWKGEAFHATLRRTSDGRSVSDINRLHSDAATLEALVAEAANTATWGRDYVREYTAPLTASLEDES